MSNAPTPYIWSAARMARSLGLPTDFVRTRIRRSPYVKDYILGATSSGQPPRLYRQECYEQIKADTAKLRKYPRLRRWVSVYQACLDCGIIETTFYRHLKHHPEFGPVEQRRGRNGRPVAAISPESYQALRAYLPAFAEIDWLTEGEICQLTGWSKYKIRRHINYHNLQSRRLRASGTNKITDHYYVPDFKSLGHKPEVPPANSWLTENQIFERLGYRPNWVRRELRTYYASVAQDRLSARRQICRHYPPWVYARIYRKDRQPYYREQAS